MLVIVALLGVLGLTVEVQKVGAVGTITINPDGSISQPTVLITKTDSTYYFADNILDYSIIVQRDNIVLNGLGYMLQGNGSGIGIDISQRTNVTLTNIKVTQFHYGILLNQSTDNKLSSNIIIDSWAGVWIESSLRNMLSQNTASNNNVYGVHLLYAANNELNYNTVLSNYDGISLWYSDENILLHNNASFNIGRGIHIFQSAGNNLLLNTASSNGYFGISLYISQNSWLAGNNMSNNRFNFLVDGDTAANFNNNIDTTNLVDGKPVYYRIGENNTIYNAGTDAGTIYLISCNNVTIRDLTLVKNGHGILLRSTAESKIRNITISDNQYGLRLDNSRHNTVAANNFTRNTYAMRLKYSNSSTILNNVIENNLYGIHMNHSSYNSFFKNSITNSSSDALSLMHSHNNTIVENTVMNNGIGDGPILHGIYLEFSDGNKIYHNNFVDNGVQAEAFSSNNTWHDGYPSGGNYWSGYTGIDDNRDAIGSSTYSIALFNVDAYPLMGMFNSFNTSLGYIVDLISNSTVENFEYFDSNTTIKIRVSNMEMDQTHGFCRLRIPHALLPSPYAITVNDDPVSYNVVQEDVEQSLIYFSYAHSTLEIVIVPEFSAQAMILVLMITTLISAMLHKRQHGKTSV